MHCIVLYCIVLQWSQFLLQDLLLFLQEVGPYTKEIFRKPPNARCCRPLGEKLNRSDFYWDVDESCNGLLLAAVLKVCLPFFFSNFLAYCMYVINNMYPYVVVNPIVIHRICVVNTSRPPLVSRKGYYYPSLGGHNDINLSRWWSRVP